MELRPERYLQVLRDHLTLTPRERRVVLFVLVSLAAGTALRWLGLIRPPAPAPQVTQSPLPTAPPDPETVQVRATPSEPRHRVSLNRADFAELLSLPGIGPQRARRLLEYRQQHGPFRKWDDLLAVPGIGPKTIEKLRPYATLDP